MKILRFVSVVTALTAGAAMAAEEGIRVGPLRLSAWGEISLTHDDNAKLVVPDGEIQDRTIFEDINDDVRTEQLDDYFYELTLGLRLFRETDSHLASLSGIYSARRYQDLTDLDNESFGEEAEIRLGDRDLDKVSFALRQAYREVFDYEDQAYPDDFTNPDTRGLSLAEDRTERVSRQLSDFAGIVTWQTTEKLGSDFSIAYGQVDYDTEVLFDWSDLKGQAEFDYRVTDKSALLLTGQYGQQESDGIENSPDYYVIRGGILNRATDKLTFKGGVGLGSYDRFRPTPNGNDTGLGTDVTTEVDAQSDEPIDFLSFDVAGDWDLTQRTTLEIIGRNAVQPAAQYVENAKLVTVASIGISHRMMEKFKLSATASYRNDEYEDPVQVDTDVFVDQEDTILGGQLRLDYDPPSGRVNVYAEAKYENRDTNVPNQDYDQVRLTIGLKLKI
jgi:hypothetical protein